ncbi:MAG: NAD(P)/FAD-dependent oxidoreductase [Parvularculaceae bacterium]|nr:NAD(P)/FAD-dependent oxidoreductase [Parvularculaceae bacterium]
MKTYDVVVIGAGAAGLFFAAEAGKRGKRVLALDHAEKLGEKIRISGGGRCNFTNLHTKPENFLSQNPKFAISALRGFTPQDFVKRVDAAGIAWHEKKLGGLFCDDTAKDIIELLIKGCHDAGVTIHAGVTVGALTKDANSFRLLTNEGTVMADKVVIATGGKSIPKIGATGFGYKIAEEFGLGIVEPRPALVPLTFDGELKEMTSDLSGVSVEASVTADPEHTMSRTKKKKPTAFRDGFLFTHRGLSGPSILQISSYWREGGAVAVDLSPANDVFEALKERRAAGGRTTFPVALAETLPKRLATQLCAQNKWSGNLADWSDKKLRAAADQIHHWKVTPAGSEGYRTAEVTLGGVNTDDLNSKTMEAKSVPGLFFIGEVVDVTGWLGGYNFQWAWASAYAAAQAI